MIGVDQLSEICTDLNQALSERESCLCRDDTVLDHTSSPPLLFEESKTCRRSSWVYTEDDHEEII
jgi:hypothetical protein